MPRFRLYHADAVVKIFSGYHWLIAARVSVMTTFELVRGEWVRTDAKCYPCSYGLGLGG